MHKMVNKYIDKWIKCSVKTWAKKKVKDEPQTEATFGLLKALYPYRFWLQSVPIVPILIYYIIMV